jgi:hypothetical protein
MMMMMTKNSWKMATVALLALTVDGFSPMTQPTTKITELNAMSFNDNILAGCDLPGNFGFDPLHLAQSRQQLVKYRKAEMKHARLAMLVRVPYHTVALIAQVHASSCLLSPTLVRSSHRL